MDYNKLDELYKKTEVLLSDCTNYLNNESDHYKSISNHLKNIMKEINIARIKSITNKINNDD